MSSNVAGTWKVRPMPSRACASGERARHVDAVEHDAAGGRQRVAGEAIEEGRLAGAVRPDQADDLALVDREIGARDRARSCRTPW